MEQTAEMPLLSVSKDELVSEKLDTQTLRWRGPWHADGRKVESYMTTFVYDEMSVVLSVSEISTEHDCRYTGSISRGGIVQQVPPHLAQACWEQARDQVKL